MHSNKGKSPRNNEEGFTPNGSPENTPNTRPNGEDFTSVAEHRSFYNGKETLNFEEFFKLMEDSISEEK